MRQGGDADRPPMRIIAQHAGRLARVVAAGHLAQPQARERAPNLFGFERQRDLGGADVARLRQNGGQIDHAKILFVLEYLVADLHETRRGVHHAVGAVLSGGERGGHDERLDAGSGLENVGGGAIAVQPGLELFAVIGVVGGLIHHGQHFARVDVDDDDGTGLRAVLLHRRLQFAIGEILNAQVDAGDEIAARPGRANALDVLHVAPVQVLNDALGAILAVQQLIVAELEALLALVIDWS